MEPNEKYRKFAKWFILSVWNVTHCWAILKKWSNMTAWVKTLIILVWLGSHFTEALPLWCLTLRKRVMRIHTSNLIGSANKLRRTTQPSTKLGGKKLAYSRCSQSFWYRQHSLETCTIRSRLTWQFHLRRRRLFNNEY